MSEVRRRELIALLGGAAAWPLAADAQQTGKVARVGFLGAGSAPGYANQLAGFIVGLRNLGYVQGTNVVIEYRWAPGHYGRRSGLVADLVRSNGNVIVTHGTPGALAAKQATASSGCSFLGAAARAPTAARSAEAVSDDRAQRQLGTADRSRICERRSAGTREYDSSAFESVLASPDLDDYLAREDA